jgi:uncharacterized protein
MKAVVIGEPSGATMDQIMAIYPRHKELVDKFIARGDVIGMGPFADRGNMAIFHTREAAEEFVSQDPFILEGMVTSVVIRDWNDEMLRRGRRTEDGGRRTQDGGPAAEDGLYLSPGWSRRLFGGAVWDSSWIASETTALRDVEGRPRGRDGRGRPPHREVAARATRMSRGGRERGRPCHWRGEGWRH